AVRLARVAILAAATGACLVGVWSGTTPLLLVAAMCLFLAALEALEPLAQDVDHPDIPAGIPMIRGELRIRHAVVPLAVMIVTAALGWGVAVAIGGGTAIGVGAVMIVPAALLATVGAAVSVVMEPPLGGSDFLPAEIAGVKTVVRAIWS